MKSSATRLTVSILTVLGLCFGGLFSTADAARTGKISGVVTDTEGRPLSGVHVMIEGTRFGTACDLDGKFIILAVPPGVYRVKVSALGYRGKNIEGVSVSSGVTTRLSVELEQVSLELEPVTVIFKRPPIELLETNERVSVTGDVIREMPVRSASDVIAAQAGVTRDASGELHLRGGRTGEIAYYIDGILIEDPLYGEESARVDRDALEELSVLSGTFNAEYGDAMSGVVQIITREGGEQYHARIEYESPMLNPSPYRKADWVRAGSDAVRDPLTGESLYQPSEVMDEDVLIPLAGRFSLNLSGPVPGVKKMTFFVNGVDNAENSHLPFGYTWLRKVSGKTAWSPKVGKLTFSGGRWAKEYQNYSHPWKYVPEQYHRHFENTTRLSLSWTHNTSENMFYTIDAGLFDRRHDVKIFEDWSDYLRVGYQPKDFTFAQYFYDKNDWSDTWREGRTQTATIGARATWQMGANHQWGAGGTFRSHKINLLDIRELQIGENGQRTGITDRYDENPFEWDLYLQDKIELDYLVMNAGLRLDVVDPRTQGWVDPEDPDSPIEDVPVSVQLSPRIGLAHPISDRLTLHFAYGHFFQFPNYVDLFLNSADLNPDTLANRSFDAVGNRTLKPQKTVAYEVGLKGLISDDWGYMITAFYKDITDLVGTRQVRVGTAYNYAAFINIDYASVIGFELGLTKQLSDSWSMQANYTYSVAKGNSSEPLEGFYNAYYELPEARQEYYMDFDRRHVLNAVLTWQAGDANVPRLFGTNLLRGMSVGVIANVASGLPYTPYSGAGEQLALRNSARMDPTIRVDLRAAKTLLFSPMRLTAYVGVDNLFNRVNPLVVNSRTGQPWETTLPGNEISFDETHNPAYVDIPRIVRLGIYAEF